MFDDTTCVCRFVRVPGKSPGVRGALRHADDLAEDKQTVAVPYLGQSQERSLKGKGTRKEAGPEEGKKGRKHKLQRLR